MGTPKSYGLLKKTARGGLQFKGTPQKPSVSGFCGEEDAELQQGVSERNRREDGATDCSGCRTIVRR